MNLKVKDICEQVRITLDQNQVETGVIAGDEDTLELNDIIEQKILQAAQQILMEAPLTWIDTTTQFGTTLPTGQDGVIRIKCPEDFLRLSIAKVSDWKIPVRVPVTDLDDEYKTVQSTFAGIRPNRTRPMVAITGSTEGQTIEFLGSEGEGKNLTIGEYIALPEFVDYSHISRDLPIEDLTPVIPGDNEVGGVTANKTLEFPQKLETALYYLTAAYVALTYKDQAAQSLFAAARSYMGIPEQPQQQTKK